MVEIGTVLTPVGKKALLCGSGELGKEVAIELQRYGVEVVMLMPRLCRSLIAVMFCLCSMAKS